MCELNSIEIPTLVVIEQLEVSVVELFVNLG
jgi:hypothetical protein